MASAFDSLIIDSVAPTLIDLLHDSEPVLYYAPGAVEGVELYAFVGNVETRIEETLEREKKVAQRILMCLANPDDETYGGLAEVHKNGTFELGVMNPDSEREIWSVVDDETDSHSPGLHRVRLQFARMRKLDGYSRA